MQIRNLKVHCSLVKNVALWSINRTYVFKYEFAKFDFLQDKHWMHEFWLTVDIILFDILWCNVEKMSQKEKVTNNFNKNLNIFQTKILHFFSSIELKIIPWFFFFFLIKSSVYFENNRIKN